MKRFSVAMLLFVASVMLPGCSAPVQRQPAVQTLPGVKVGPEVVVSADHPRFEYAEMLAAGNPANPNDLIACSIGNDGEHGKSYNILFSSFDGGSAWRTTSLPDSYDMHADPACSYGADNVAWFEDGGSNLAVGKVQKGWLDFYKSTDAGSTWKRVVHLPSDYDRAYVIGDASHGRYRGRAYAYGWGNFVDRNYKMTGASEFLWPIVRNRVLARAQMSDEKNYAQYALTAGAGIVTPSDVVVIPMLIFANGNPKGIQPPWEAISRSFDGGKSITPATKLADDIQCRPGGGMPPPPLANDTSSGPFNGRIYYAWEGGDVQAPHGVNNHCIVNVAYSDDDGKTWSTPTNIHENDDRSMGVQPEQYMPALAVNKNGVVALTWYDTREDPIHRVLRLRAAFSYDGGRSFSSSIPVSENGQDYRLTQQFAFLMNASGGGFPGNSDDAPGSKNDNLQLEFQRLFSELPGHTRAVVADTNGTFHPFWFSNMLSNVGPQYATELLTDAISVDGRAWRNGDAALEGMRDITPDLAMRVVGSNYDIANGTINVTLRLVNNSTAPITGPAKMRMFWADSLFGQPTMTSPTANGIPGNGAVVDVSSALGGTLAPSSQSRPIQLTFHINSGPQSQLRDYSAFNFSSRVYGR